MRQNPSLVSVPATQFKRIMYRTQLPQNFSRVGNGAGACDTGLPRLRGTKKKRFFYAIFVVLTPGFDEDTSLTRRKGMTRTLECWLSKHIRYSAILINRAVARRILTVS